MRRRPWDIPADERRLFATAAREVGRRAESLGRGWLSYDLDLAATAEEAIAMDQDERDAR